MTKAIVNGKKQDIIITSSFKNSEFDKLGKKLPYSVLEYLFVNKYKYLDIKKCLDNNDNITVNFHNPDNVTVDGEIRVLSKFRINGDTLENLISNNKKDRILKLNLGNLLLDSKILKRGQYPFYAIVTLTKEDETIFVNHIEFLEAISINMEEYKALRKNYSSQEWLNLIFSTIGYNADTLTPFEKYSLLVRLIPFCIEQYHIIELGNKETAKSYFYSVMSDIVYSSSISAGSISMAQLVKNNSTHEPGLLAKKNIVNFDEIPEAHWKDNDIISTLQTYLQDGIANRDDGLIVSRASLVFTGNISDFEDSALKNESLFNHFKAEIRNETIIDKLYFFTPGWKFTKINPNKYTETDAPRIRRDYFLCALNLLREEYKEYSEVFKDTVRFTNTESGRDMRVSATIAGLIMLLHPDIESMSTEELEAFAYIALTGRKILLRELEIKNKNEYKNRLVVQNSQINEKIEFDVLSNFIINTSETFLKSHNISIDNIEYYYLDYYKDYDVTKEINTQYGFVLIEPTIVIKCSNNPKVYKLAISSYGINMNILEVSENKKKKNTSCKNLTENFMLIETDEIKDNVKKLYVKRFTKSSIRILKDLKEKHKEQPFMLDIIDIIVAEQEKNSMLSNTIKNLENKIDIQNKKTDENQNKLSKMDSILIIQSIINEILTSQSDILKELNSINFLLLSCLDDTSEISHTPLNLGYTAPHYLGFHTFTDTIGSFRNVYIAQPNNPLLLVGKCYNNDNFISFPPIYVTKNLNDYKKIEIINQDLKNHCNILNNIISFLTSNKIVKLVSLYYLNNSIDSIFELIKDLSSSINYVDSLIKNEDYFKNVFSKLNVNTNFHLNTISKYHELLEDLLKNVKSYKDTYIKNNSPSNTLEASLDLKENIFDNNYITDLKENSQN